MTKRPILQKKYPIEIKKNIRHRQRWLSALPSVQSMLAISSQLQIRIVRTTYTFTGPFLFKQTFLIYSVMTVADMRALPEYKVLLHRKYTVLLLHWVKKVQPASYSAWISSIPRNWFSVDIGLRCDRWQLPPQFVLILELILFVSVYEWPWNINQIHNFAIFFLKWPHAL